MPYRYMVRLVFPHALIVADAFHLHRRVLDALSEVRRAATHRIGRGRSGRARLPKQARFALARARDSLEADTSPRGARQRAAVAEVCGLDPPLALAYELKEAFRALMAIGKTGAAAAFEAGLSTFDQRCRASKLAPYVTVANGFRSWRTEIINLRPHRRRQQRLRRSHQPSHQEPEAPSAWLPQLDRVPRPNPVVLRRSCRPRNRRDRAATLNPARPRSPLHPTSIRVEPIFVT